MGAYLSAPNRDKDSIDYNGKLYSYGACSMQGWRMSQEDSHNCCEDYDEDTTLFAVYDGHGGSEVAQYTAQEFPAFIKTIAAYKNGQLSQALEDAFLEFDATLTQEDVIHRLKELAGVTEDEPQNDEEKEEEVAGLYEEADMPLEKLLERYQGGDGLKTLRELRKKENVPSPALRGKSDSEKNKSNTADIKADLGDKLVNGDVECNGKHTTESETETKPQVKSESETNVKSETGREADSGKSETGEAESEGKPDKMEVEEDQVKQEVTKDNSNEVQKDSVKSDKTESDKTESDKPEAESSTTKTENDKTDTISANTPEKNSVTNTENNSTPKENENEATPSDNSCSSDKAVDKSSTPDSTLPDSSSNSSAVKSSDTQNTDSNGDTQVTSSSTEKQKSKSGKGQGSKGKGAGKGEGGSVSGSSEGQGSGSSEQAGSADSSSKDEAGSSTGRRRSGRTGVIPAEGEDETSEEEETTSEEDSEDEEDFCEDDSEDDDDELDELEDEDEMDDEEDGTGIMYGGEEPGADSGCTAVVALLRGRELYVANAGDSRCVVCRDGKAVDMSFDHKPEDELELQRIVKAGGTVTPEGRVNGGLNLSRALGDHAYKRTATLPLKEQMITSLPDVRTLTLNDKDEFMILACDGIWNSLSSQDTVNFVRDRLNGDREKLSTICEEMFEFILAPDTGGDGTGCDNMTCIIVTFTDALRTLPTTRTDSGATKRPASESTPGTDAGAQAGDNIVTGDEGSEEVTGSVCKKAKEGD